MGERTGLKFAMELSLEVRAFINGDAPGYDVANDNGRLLQVNPVARLNIAFQSAMHDHSASNDVGFNASVSARWSDGFLSGRWCLPPVHLSEGLRCTSEGLRCTRVPL
jgi:hypothetical protein